MTGSQTINLSDRISNQLTGIVLCWSDYNNGHASNYEWSFQFIPKDYVMRGFASNLYNVTHFMISIDANGAHAGAKSVHITDTTIKGDDRNSSNVTAGGITLNNARWVLRYVFGV